MKKTRARLAIAMAIACASPQASAQFAVVDMTNNVQSKIHHAAELAKMTEQLTQMRDQYEQMRKDYAAITGSYERGNFGADTTQKARNVVPGSWQDVVQRQAGGEYGTALEAAEAKIATLGDEAFVDPVGQSAKSYRMSTDAVRTTFATGEVLYGQIDQHMSNLTQLQAQIDETQNIKDAQDLNNRIQVENGLLQGALARLTVVNNHLAANQLNEQNRARALLKSASKRPSGTTSPQSGGGF